MKDLFKSSSGMPLPLGATKISQGINFSLFSRNATAVELVISFAQSDSKPTVYKLDQHYNKTGDIWHILLHDIPDDIHYGYRVSGPVFPGDNGQFYNQKLTLFDPYGKQFLATGWGRRDNISNTMPACLVPLRKYDWEEDLQPNIPLKDSIIYEMHIRGFTQHSSSNTTYPGTYRALIEKIPYLKELGITAVELMPVTEFNENESIFVNPETGETLKNFWGYSPLSFFAPKSSYSSNPENPLDEFRDMVKAMHREGIEVILDIVYNHTGEGGYDGPTSCFRGIDNTIYYLLDPWTRAYLNFSGCGNTCNCNHPIVRSLIIDALRWWVIDMHVDGFRFDLASILGRDATGLVLANPPVVERIAEDPVLANIKIIAEAWDAAGLYQVGSFSDHHRWAEWNGRFRDDVRSFLCGHPEKVSLLATRIAGSSDLYQDDGRQPYNSINFVTSHDGFTLADLVSYNEKHNLINGEDNRDGDNHNISWNSGAEGPTNDRDIQRLRKRRIKTFAAILFLSQGVPMLTAGDEFGRTQQGNNNAWCQDNEISWVNWQLAEDNKDQLRFFRHLIRLRKNHAVFRREDFFLARDNEEEPQHLREIRWQGLRPGEQDWSYNCHTLSFLLNGTMLDLGESDDFFIMLNGHVHKSATFTIPPPPDPKHRIWKKIIDTSQDAPVDIIPHNLAGECQAGEEIETLPMACIVLQSTSHI